MSGDNPLVDSDAKISAQNDGYHPNNGIAYISDVSRISQGLDDMSHSMVAGVQDSGLPNPSALLETLCGIAELGCDFRALESDPLGTLEQCVVPWVLRHVPLLRMILDGFAGNPDAINGYTTTWNNIATRIGQVAEEFAGTAKSGPGNWTGAAADEYAEMAQDTLTVLVSVGTMAKALATVISGLGQYVAGARLIVANMIAIVVTTLTVDIAEMIAGDEESGVAVMIRLLKVSKEAGDVAKAAVAVVSAVDTLVSQFAVLADGFADAEHRWSGGVG